MTGSTPLGAAASAFSDLADRVYAGESYDGVYEAICKVAVEVVPGCDHACVTTMRAGERPVCEASTDDVARVIDELEWETGEGPCLDAILSNRFEWDPDITRGSAWPKLAERALRETPVRGMIGYRLLAGERKVGALNLLSDRAGAFTEGAADIGAIVASFASVAIGAARHHEAADSLRAGLESNREIGKAVGLLMATHDSTDDQAFAMLRDASSRLNVRLADLARQAVREHNGRAGGA